MENHGGYFYVLRSLNAGFSSAMFDYQRAMADDRVSVGRPGLKCLGL